MGRSTTQLRRLAVGAALVLTLGLAACGGSGKDEQAIRKRVTTFYGALAAKDPAASCNSMSASLKRAVTRTPSGTGGPRSCQVALRFNFLLSGNTFRNGAKVKVAKTEVKGDRAGATVTFRGRKEQVGLVKQGGRWLISTLNLKKL